MDPVPKKALAGYSSIAQHQVSVLADAMTLVPDASVAV